MTLRQLTKPVAPLKPDVQKPDENLNPLVPDLQDPSSGPEDYPIPNYQFKVLMIPDRDAASPTSTEVALFQKVSGMTVSRETDSLSEGGHNEFSFEFPGQISYGHITFEAGLTSNRFFYNWMMAGLYKGTAHNIDFDLVQRRPNPNYDSSDPSSEIFEEIKIWQFNDAFPVKWKISNLSMGNSKSIVIESLELSFNWFELAPPP